MDQQQLLLDRLLVGCSKGTCCCGQAVGDMGCMERPACNIPPETISCPALDRYDTSSRDSAGMLPGRSQNMGVSRGANIIMYTCDTKSSSIEDTSIITQANAQMRCSRLQSAAMHANPTSTRIAHMSHQTTFAQWLQVHCLSALHMQARPSLTTLLPSRLPDNSPRPEVYHSAQSAAPVSGTRTGGTPAQGVRQPIAPTGRGRRLDE